MLFKRGIFSFLLFAISSYLNPCVMGCQFPLKNGITTMLSLFFFESFSQNIGIGTTTPHPRAALDVRSTNRGLLMPRVSTTARNAIANPPKSLMLYDTTAGNFFYYDGSRWRTFSEGNYDSAVTTVYPGEIPDTAIIMSGSFGTRNTTKVTGFIFDNGGPNGNYSNNVNGGIFLTVQQDNVLYYKIEVQALNLEPNNDFLRIASSAVVAGFGTGERVFTGNMTDTFYIYNNRINFSFTSNGLVNQSGFRVKWTAITGNAEKNPAPPLMGWHFNGPKLAGRAGFNTNNVLWDNSLIGRNSYALGTNATAESLNSLAMGTEVNAADTAAIAIGFRSMATANGGISIGTLNDVFAPLGIALGYGNTSTGTALAPLSIGYINNASGESAMAIGFSNVASGNAAPTALGWNNEVTGNGGVAIGADNFVEAERAFCFGTALRVRAPYAGAIGTKFNIPPAAAGSLGIDDLEFSNTPVDITGIGIANQMVARFRGGYYFMTSANAPGGSAANRTGMVMGGGSNSWSAISDERRKENFVPVDGENILQKIAAMPLTTWNYKAQDPATMRHYGPMAQDFFAAFGKDAMGIIGNDTLINQQDFLGVNLVAIQALEKRTRAQMQLLQQLTEQLAALKEENEKLREALLKKGSNRP
jgi:hypothetical protein